MLKNITQQIKKKYRENPIESIFMGAVIILSLITLFKPDYTSGLISKIGFGLIQFFIILALVLGLIYFVKINKIFKK